MSLQRGKLAEQACCDFLRRAGLKPVSRNYRCRRGEIDLVMRDGDTLVFVEVRYRNSSAFGGALVSVDAAKQARLVATALHYAQHYRITDPMRIDVIGMRQTKDNDYEFQWIRDAIQA